MQRLLIVLALLSSTACIIAVDDGSSSLTIVNESRWNIHEIYVSRSSDRNWGEDLLGNDILYSGESLTVDYLDCDDYDVKVVDEDRVACEVYDQHICFDDDYWVITNTTLRDCWS